MTRVKRKAERLRVRKADMKAVCPRHGETFIEDVYIAGVALGCGCGWDNQWKHWQHISVRHENKQSRKSP